MSVKIENIEKNVVQLEIEVDAEKFEEGMQKAFLKSAKRYNVPGFRKGKAPRKMVERMYGEQVLYEEAINIVCPEAYEEAIDENNIQPVDRPDIDIKQIGDGQNLIFTAKVTTKPEVELGDYKGVEVSKIDVNVSDEDIEKELNDIADKNARMVTIEDRGIQNGDYATIDFEGFIDGVPFEGGKALNHRLVVGQGQFIPGFEDQLIGVKTGEEIDVNVTFPEDYGKPELDGKAALFKVKVNEIKAKELPVIDDEFAKDVSEFDTLAEYKEDLKKKLIEKAEHKAKHDTEDNVVNKVVENATVEIPQVMIDKQIEVLLRDFDYRLRSQGLDLAKYMEVTGMNVDIMKGQFKERAQKDVLTQLVIEKVGNVENINVSDEDFDAEIKRLSEIYKKSEEEFKKQIGEDDIEYIKKDLVVGKTIDFLVENAKIV